MWFGGLWGEDDAEHAGAPASASSSPSLRQQQASNEGEGDPKGASWFRSSPGYLLRVYGSGGAFRWKAHHGRVNQQGRPMVLLPRILRATVVNVQRYVLFNDKRCRV